MKHPEDNTRQVDSPALPGSRADPVSTILTYLVCILATWTIWTNCVVSLEMSFATLRWGALAVTLLSVILAYSIVNEDKRQSGLPADSVHHKHGLNAHAWSFGNTGLTPVLSSFAIVLVAGYAVTDQAVLVWGLGTVLALSLVTVRWTSKPRIKQHDSYTLTTRDGLGLCAIMTLAVLFSLMTYRSDADDAFYINLAANALDNPHQPIMRFDTILGIEQFPLLGAWYRVQSFEMLVALVSDLTGLPPYSTTHLVIAPAFSAISILTAYHFVRWFTPGRALLGAAAFLLILTAWGDVHRAYGNFGLVRMFQGKAVMATVMLPLLAVFVLKAMDTNRRSDLMRVALTGIATVGMSSNAVAVAPMLAGVLFAGKVLGHSDSRFKLAKAALPLVLIVTIASCYAALIFTLSDPVAENIERAWKQVSSPKHNWETVTGEGLREKLALLGLLLLPLSVRDRQRKSVAAMFAIAFFVLTTPWIKSAISHLFPANFSWRIFWAIPVPVLLATLFAALLTGNGSHKSGHRMVMATIALTIFVLAPGNTTMSIGAKTHTGFSWKLIDQHQLIARRVAEVTRPDDLVLAPEEISWQLATVRDSPHLVIGRLMYIFGYQHQSRFRDILAQRRQLFVCASHARNCPDRLDDMLSNIHDGKLRAIILANNHPLVAQRANSTLEPLLQVETINNFVLWHSKK